MKASGGKNETTNFLFTDSQIKDESFVEDINNLLNTSEVPNLFASEEKAEITELVRAGYAAINKEGEATLV
jgi:dynein heavy chain